MRLVFDGCRPMVHILSVCLLWTWPLKSIYLSRAHWKRHVGRNRSCSQWLYSYVLRMRTATMEDLFCFHFTKSTKRDWNQNPYISFSREEKIYPSGFFFQSDRKRWCCCWDWKRREILFKYFFNLLLQTLLSKISDNPFFVWFSHSSVNLQFK